MTAKKTSNTDPDIIEGVAVEKPAPSTSRRRAAGREKSPSGTGASEQRPASASAGASASDSADKASPDSMQSGKSAGKSAETSSDAPAASDVPARRESMPVILGAAAILLALGGIIIQQWMAARQKTQLRAEIETLVAQIELVNGSLANAQAQVITIGVSQDAVVSRLARLEADLPQDPAEALAVLAERLDTLAADLAALPADNDVTLSPFESGLALAQTGLGAANAMNAANLAGGDPAQWVPVLQELARAGLDVGDLEEIETLLTARPAPTVQLLAEGVALATVAESDRESDSGWWQNATGRIAGFIKLRRSDDAPATGESVAETATPLDEFERTLRTGRLGDALVSSRKIIPLPAGLDDWQSRAQRRLDLEAGLAGLVARMTAQLAAAGVAD